jgi:hypothetical protein
MWTDSLGRYSFHRPFRLRGLFNERPVKQPLLDSAVADVAPAEATLTAYDEQHLIIYLRLLDADAEKVDWREVAQIVLQIDPVQEPDRARDAFVSHLARAKWMSESGYRQLLRGGTPSQAKAFRTTLGV